MSLVIGVAEGVGFPGGFTMIGSNTVAVLQAPQATSVQVSNGV